MEDERKRKKNKRKKNKPNKTADSASVSAGESVASDQNPVNGNEQNHQSQVSESSDAKEDFQRVDVETRKYHDNINQAATLEEKIKQLQMEKDVHLQKEADLEMRIFQLEGEKDSWLQKEAGYEERVNQLIDGTATLSLRGVGLEEKISLMEKERDSWVQKEGATKETIARVYNDNVRLQEQVLELQELKDKLLLENQHLTENISSLHSQIQNFERNSSSAHLFTESITRVAENEVLKSELEASRALAEKLLSENSELVEKVNELYVELNQRSAISDPMVGPPLVSNPTAGSAGKRHASIHTPPAPIFRSSDGLMGSLENITLNSERDGSSSYRTDEITPYSPETIKSEEIVQISLHENEVNKYKDLESAHTEEKIEVPISDAPLIGAPFRLISFVARYVSGADLVGSSSINTDR